MLVTGNQVRAEYLEKYGALVNWNELDDLIGKLLTHIDAIILDPTSREANKSIVKMLVREWMRENDRDSVWGGLHLKALSNDHATGYHYEAEKDNGENPRSSN
jgi:hypothetical protein